MGLQDVLGNGKFSFAIEGKEYLASPLTLEDISDAEEKFGCDLNGFDKVMSKSKNIAFLIYLMLRKKNPEITESVVLKNVSFADLNKVFSASGLVQPKNVEGADSTTVPGSTQAS